MDSKIEGADISAVYPNRNFCWYCGFSFGVFDYGSELWVCQDCFHEKVRDVYGSVEAVDVQTES